MSNEEVLQEKLLIVDELSKAYQRIVSCGDKAKCKAMVVDNVESTLLNKIRNIVEGLQNQE